MKILKFEQLQQKEFVEMASKPAETRKIVAFCIDKKWYLTIRRRRTLHIFCGENGLLRSMTTLSAVCNLMDLAEVAEFGVNHVYKNMICPYPKTSTNDRNNWLVAQLQELVPNSIGKNELEEMDLVDVAKKLNMKKPCQQPTTKETPNNSVFQIPMANF